MTGPAFLCRKPAFCAPRQSQALYAWQSDRPANVNRSFIQRASERAVKCLIQDTTLDVEIAIDRGTSGLGGTPPVSQAILAKIPPAMCFLGPHHGRPHAFRDPELCAATTLQLGT